MKIRALFLSFVLALAAGLGTPAHAAYDPGIGVDALASGTITTQNLVPAGTATASSAVEISCSGRGGFALQVTGTYTGVLSVQATVNGTTWVTSAGVSILKNINSDAYAATIASGTTGIYFGNCAGFAKIRLTALSSVTGTATVTVNANNSMPSVAINSALPAGAAALGSVIVSSMPATTAVNVSPSTSVGAATTSHTVSAASTNATSIVAGAHTIYNINVCNLNAAARYLKIYNKGSAPTVGTDTPVMTIMLPPGQMVNLAFPFGFRLATGTAFALTTGIAVADTGAVSAAEHVVNILYI